MASCSAAGLLGPGRLVWLRTGGFARHLHRLGLPGSHAQNTLSPGETWGESLGHLSLLGLRPQVRLAVRAAAAAVAAGPDWAWAEVGVKRLRKQVPVTVESI